LYLYVLTKIKKHNIKKHKNIKLKFKKYKQNIKQIKNTFGLHTQKFIARVPWPLPPLPPQLQIPI